MNKPVKQLALVIVILTWTAVPVAAQGDFKISFQADASNYPAINLYVSVTDAGGQPVSGLTKDNFEVTEDGQPVAIDGFAGIGDPRPVDIVFVFDVTGSMRQEIEGVKETCVKFAERLSRSGRDYRLGLVTFLDVIGRVYRADGSLMDNVQEFKGWISELRAIGGDDDPEIALDALLRAAQMKFRSNTQRILILITDAPPHYQGDGTRFSSTTFDETVATLKKNNLTVYAVAPSSASMARYRLPSGSGYELLATALGGKFYDIEHSPDFVGIIDAIGVAISTQYKLTYRTPRPTPDGTLRDIRVKVGKEGKSGGGGGAYLERHLLNVKSDPWVGLACLLPLLVALLVPAASSLYRSTASAPQPAAVSPLPSTYPTPPRVPTVPVAQTYPVKTQRGGTYPTPPPPVQPAHTPTVQPSPPAPATATVCSRCGAPLRPGAKFCSRCGAVHGAPSAVPSAPAVCPRCGNVNKSNVKFCNRCGNQLGQ
jgi:VWFA-related protein